MDLTDDGIEMDSSAEHPKNAFSPKEATEFGISTDARDVQL